MFIAEGGEHDFGRAVAAISPRIDGGDLLIATEYMRNDGPWLLDEQLRKLNGVIKYSRGDREDGRAWLARFRSARAWRGCA